jgi:pantothenate synthetase
LSNQWKPKEIIYKNKKILLGKGVKKIDYFELRSETLKKNVKRNGKSRLFIAAFIGSTRLIDNLKVN